MGNGIGEDIYKDSQIKIVGSSSIGGHEMYFKWPFEDWSGRKGYEIPKGGLEKLAQIKRETFFKEMDSLNSRAKFGAENLGLSPQDLQVAVLKAFIEENRFMDSDSDV
jgi:hypothetical protein